MGAPIAGLAGGASPATKPRRSTSPGSYLAPATGGIGSLQSSATMNTYGSWVELLASAGADGVILGFAHRISTLADYPFVDIGIGAAASEVSTGEYPGYRGGGVNEQVFIPFPDPIAIASGDRIAVRCRDGTASALWHQVALVLVNESDREAWDA